MCRPFVIQLTSRADIEAAAARVKSVAVRTPLLPLTQLSVSTPDRPLRLKLENLQPTGAFKIRGALNALAQLSEERRGIGVLTHSSGNHGLALAFAVLVIGPPVVVVVPPYDHPDVIAGQGALGSEVLEDLPTVKTVLLPVSGGGLISGVAAAVGWLARNARIVVEPSGAVATAAYLQAGLPADLTVAVVSGGNVDPALYSRLLSL